VNTLQTWKGNVGVVREFIPVCRPMYSQILFVP
jgi:hypothetical protein